MIFQQIYYFFNISTASINKEYVNKMKQNNISSFQFTPCFTQYTCHNFQITSIRNTTCAR